MALRKTAQYKYLNINVVTSTKVTSIDREKKVVKAGKGKAFLMTSFAFAPAQSLCPSYGKCG